MPTELERAATELTESILEREREFALELIGIESATRLARDADIPRGRPLILADTQDNPGAGGNADTTSLLKALVAEQRRRRARRRDLGCRVRCKARTPPGWARRWNWRSARAAGFPGETPLVTRFTVERLGDGRFIGTGPFYRGGRFELGPDGAAAHGRDANRRGLPQAAGG